MSAMPAFGPFHSDEDIWAIVAFLNRLPDLTPETYENMGEKKGPTLEDFTEGGHEHN